MNNKSSFDVVDTDDRSKWAEAHSDWERYFPTDLFFVSMTFGLAQKITRFDRDWKDWAFYVVLLTLLFMVLAIQLNKLVLFLPTVLLDLFYPFLILDEWFGRIFGVSYAPMLGIIPLTQVVAFHRDSRNPCVCNIRFASFTRLPRPFFGSRNGVRMELTAAS